jgi:ATP/ADP translocase
MAGLTASHGVQVGKCGASWATQALLLVMGSIPAALPLVAAVYLAVIGAWIVAVGCLSRRVEVCSPRNFHRLPLRG